MKNCPNKYGSMIAKWLLLNKRRNWLVPNIVSLVENNNAPTKYMAKGHTPTISPQMAKVMLLKTMLP